MMNFIKDIIPISCILEKQNAPFSKESNNGRKHNEQVEQSIKRSAGSPA
jgi:hypothetical protein